MNSLDNVKFPFLVHTVEREYALYALPRINAGAPWTDDIICTIAGFNSRSYAEEFALKHSKLGGSATVIVTWRDLKDGILAAFRSGRTVHDRGGGLSHGTIGPCTRRRRARIRSHG